MISIAQGLRLMELKDRRGWPQPFSIEFFTADRKRDKGGELISLKSAVLSKNSREKNKPSQSTGIPKMDTGQYISGTRNLLIPETKEVITCHIWLIHKINGQQVAI
ncbi:hypothetical protein EFA69_16235 [Rufibacter immobilis]|uniref:Uncharacterized protein n=1 Tax=Rufibacter immobilis TaxID=1348778 RepID=A0A3M9MQ68_9BACT|nr:hypothetical protein [Rufibacter immobilis]RNI27666.1 hypothetical protein EFA69_16235 [Rufibacter immobilis]